MFAIEFFALIVFEFCSIVLIFFDLQKWLNFIFSSFKSIVTTFVFFFFVVFFVARNRDLFDNVRICIRINHAHITFVDVDRTRSLIYRVNINCIRNRRRVFRRDWIRCARICVRINHGHIIFDDIDRICSFICRVKMNNIRNHLDRRNRRIHDVIDDENKHFANEKKNLRILRIENRFCESKIDFTKNNWFLRKKMTERSKIFSKKKFQIEKKKRKSEKRWSLYAKFDVQITKWYFCEMIWLTRFYNFYVFYERVFFIRSICYLYFIYFTNAILCSINKSFVFYVFYERTSLFN